MSLVQALEERFTDPDEIRDIVNHGIDSGFDGFLYSTELAEFFEEHEDDIEDYLNDMGMTLNDIIPDPTCWTYQELKERSVWIAVESWCHCKVDELENE